MENKHCLGCSSSSPNPQALCRAINNDGSCPCTNCIVKVMCVDECSPFEDWYLSYD